MMEQGTNVVAIETVSEQEMQEIEAMYQQAEETLSYIEHDTESTENDHRKRQKINHNKEVINLVDDEEHVTLPPPTAKQDHSILSKPTTVRYWSTKYHQFLSITNVLVFQKEKGSLIFCLTECELYSWGIIQA
jgi:hypothetical protein